MREFFIPDAWNFHAAELTLSIYNVIFKNAKMDTVNQPLLASGAECGIISMARDITDGYIIQSRLLCYMVSLLQLLYGCRWQVNQLIGREKSGEV